MYVNWGCELFAPAAIRISRQGLPKPLVGLVSDYFGVIWNFLLWERKYPKTRK